MGASASLSKIADTNKHESQRQPKPEPGAPPKALKTISIEDHKAVKANAIVNKHADTIKHESKRDEQLWMKGLPVGSNTQHSNNCQHNVHKNTTGHNLSAPVSLKRV